MKSTTAPAQEKSLAAEKSLTIKGGLVFDSMCSDSLIRTEISEKSTQKPFSELSAGQIGSTPDITLQPSLIRTSSVKS
jgi:hypothetical protein